MKAKLDTLLKEKKASTKDAFQIFDALEPATADFMIGRWKGYSIYSEHQLDGELESTGWYGKMFLNREEVHPLLFFTEDKKEIFSVNPTGRIASSSQQKDKTVGLEKTKLAKARLRNTEYRGRLCATMIYDELPVLDVFVKIDDTKVLGVMDKKDDPTSFFFILERDDQSNLKLDI
ncbi:DUF4334 domain-containing protein [Myroides sp. DW712]|uniref:DUF4334 domain-containing protein n=1 Tax=Myroides sp. DW712 TaxID=3389800 RepID=UPI003979D492